MFELTVLVYSHEHLFDRVLELSTVSVTSEALRRLLNWHLPIPIGVVLRQFELCVGDKNVSPNTMRSLISELAKRRSEFSMGDVVELRNAAAGKRWVPVDDRLYREIHVVFKLTVELPPFCLYVTRSEAKRSFLLEMGCSERRVS